MNDHLERAHRIKHSFRQKGTTLTAWARENGYKYRDVSDVIRGIRRGNYGVGREIAEKLGLVQSSGA